MKNIFIFLLILSIPFGGNCINKYWIGNAGTNFNTASNWSTTSGGTANTTVPGSSDVAIFDGGKNTKCIISATVNVQGIEMRTGYSDSLVFNTGTTASTISVGSAGFILQSGIFRAFTAGKTGPGNITISGPLTISGGNFMGYNGPNAATTQTVTGTFTVSGGTYTASKNTTNLQNGMIKSGGTFNYNTGSTFNFQGKLANSGIINIDFNNTAVNFNNVTFTTGSQWDMVANIASGSTIIANGNLIISHNSAYKSDINAGTIEVRGNLTASGNGLETGGGTGTIIINGSGAQTLTGSGTALKSPLPNVTINKTAGTISLSSVITCKKNLTLASTSTIAPLPGTSTVVFTGNDGAIVDNSGSVDFTFYNLTVNDVAGSGSTTTLVVPTSCSVSNTLNIAGASQVSINGGTIKVNDSGVAKGVNLTNTNTTGGGGTATIEMTYTASNIQYINGNTAGTGFLPNVSVNKPGGSISIKDVVAIKGNLTFNGTTNYAINKNGTTEGKIKLSGNLNIPLASKVNGGTATIEICGTGDQSIVGTTTAGTGKLCRVTIAKTTGNLTLTDVINLNAKFEYQQGTIIHSIGELIRVYTVDTLDLQGSSSNMAFQAVSFETGTNKITGKLSVLGDLTIKASTTLNSNGFDIELGGHWDNSGTFTSSAGKVVFVNNASKTIKGSATHAFSNIQMNGSGGIVLTGNISITGNLDMSLGNITSTSSTLLSIADNGTVSNASKNSFVMGPIKKIGNDQFTFPTGGNGAFRPIKISAPSVTTDAFTAEYLSSAPTNPFSLGDSIDIISTCENWTLSRNVGTSNVYLTMFWDSTTCVKGGEMTDNIIAYYNGSQWRDIGALDFSGNDESGNGTTRAGAANFPLTITWAIKKRNYPYAALKYKLDGGYATAMGGQLRFTYYNHYQDADDKLTFKIYDSNNNLVWSDNNQGPINPPYGENRLSINLNCAGAQLSSGYYILEVINSKNEKFYLRFRKPSNVSC
jgi:hypothetical protein